MNRDHDLLTLMMRHRSIRRFKQSHLSDELVAELAEAGRSASTSSYTQPYSIIRVKDPVKLHVLAGLCGDQEYVENAGAFLVFLADLQKLRMAAEHHSRIFQEGYVESLLMAVTDTAILGQSMLLAAESMGLGGVFIGGLRNHPGDVCELLEIPELVLPLFGMCLGEPDQSPLERPRLPLKTVLMTDTYQATQAEALAEYDEAVREYYINRTKGKQKQNWTEQMAEKMTGELRPHMWDFLAKQKLLIR